VRIADRHHELAHAQVLGVPEAGGREVARLRPQDREVRQAVGAHDLERDLAAVHERGQAAAAGGAPPGGHDVRGGQQEAVAREHHRAARRPPPPAGRRACAAGP
jgi:hypothetical protein